MVEPTLLKNMRTSNWIIMDHFPRYPGENFQNMDVKRRLKISSRFVTYPSEVINSMKRHSAVETGAGTR